MLRCDYSMEVRRRTIKGEGVRNLIVVAISPGGNSPECKLNNSKVRYGGHHTWKWFGSWK